MPRFELTLCLVVVSLGMLPVAARAQLPDAADPTPLAEQAPKPTKLALGAEFGITSRKQSGSELWVVSPLLAARYEWNDAFALGLDWGAVIASESTDQGKAQSAFALGNPMLYARFGLLQTLEDRLHVQLSLVPPITWLPTGVLDRGFVRGALASAAATRGLWNAWLWGPELAALVAGLRWSHVFSGLGYLRAGAEGDIALTTPLSYTTRTVAAVFLQLAPSLELFVGGFAVGMRVQGVLMSASSDALQFSTGGYVRFDLDRVSLQINAMLNLDEPLGVTGTGLGIGGVLIYLRGNL